MNLKWIVIVLLDIIAISLSLLKPETTLMVTVLVLWSNGFVFTLENIDERGPLFAFLVAFFLILIGREALEVFGLHEVEASFKENINRHAELLILISLISLYAGYYLANKARFGKEPRPYIFLNNRYYSIRKYSELLFYFTFAFNLFTVLDVVLYVLRNGYFVYYTSYVSSVPYVIKKIGDMCVVCFWVFLATLPDKKQVGRLSCFYVFYLLLTLGTGRRFPFVSGMLTLFVYYIFRNRYRSGEKVWVRKQTMILLFLFAPLSIILLYVIGQVRAGNAVDFTAVGKMFSDFIYGQGVSINVIKRAQIYKKFLPKGKLYLFGSTYESIVNNVIFRIFGVKGYAGNTIEHAVNGYSFQHALSYAAMGSYYLAGHGLGSCYIAEAFHDLGYFGVVIVNFIYGVMFRKVFDFKRHGIFGTAIILSMLNSLLLAPRGSADGFISDVVDLTTWGTFIIIWLLYKGFRISMNNNSSESCKL